MARFEYPEGPISPAFDLRGDQHTRSECQRYGIGSIASLCHGEDEVCRLSSPLTHPFFHGIPQLFGKLSVAAHVASVERPSQQALQVRDVHGEPDRRPEQFSPERIGTEAAALGSHGAPATEVFDGSVGEPIVLHELRIDLVCGKLLLHETPAID
jgi:hypothetical protein